MALIRKLGLKSLLLCGACCFVACTQDDISTTPFGKKKSSKSDGSDSSITETDEVSTDGGSIEDDGEQGAEGSDADDDDVTSKLKIGRACTVVRAWTNLSGAAYLPALPSPPSDLTEKSYDLHANEIEASDLAGIDVFLFSDARLDATQVANEGFRSLFTNEKPLFKTALEQGTTFVLVGDRAAHAGGDASFGTRELLGALTTAIEYAGDDGKGVTSGKVASSADGPLPGLTFEFSSAKGTDHPGTLVLSGPARCALEASGKCRVAAVSAKGGSGAVIVSASGEQKSLSLLIGAINRACK